MKDAEARRRIGEDLETTFVVEAAAGTGKTTALIGRIVAAVAAGGRLERMVAVTFTEKAAGEMKIRLRDELERARRETTGEQRARFVAALEALELAFVGTIHGFCGELLKERPVEAAIDPRFEMCTEEDVDGLVGQTFDLWFQKALADPPPGVARVLHMKRWGRDSGPRELLRRSVRDLVEHRDFPTRWSRPPFEREPRLLACLDALRDVGALANEAPDAKNYLWQALEKIRRFSVEADGRLAAVEARPPGETRDVARHQLLDRLEADLRDFGKKSQKHWTWKGWRQDMFGTLRRDDVLEKREAARQLLRSYIEDAEQDLAAALQVELWPLVGEYERRKRLLGRLDFLDLLLKTRDLLRRNAGVRWQLQQRFSHVFVDEFQDTDPVQVEVLFLLSATDPDQAEWREVKLQPGKLFVVGDPKQAVYRFRRADLAVYQQAKKSVLAAGGEVLELSTSFRSVPSLQRVINHAFAERMGTGESHQARYVPLAPHRDPVETQPSVVALPVPEPYGDFGTNYYVGAVSDSTAQSVCAFVEWLVKESGWKVGTERRAVGFGDIALVFTRMSSMWRDVTTPYVQGLAQRGVPHILHGGRSFHEREEIRALRQASAAIEWPDDPLAVYSVLRGPFFGIDDSTLLAYRAVARGSVPREHHPFHPFANRSGWTLGESEHAVGEALDLLAELHLHRNRRPIADTITSFLEATRGTATLSFWPAPKQTLSNVDRFVEHARRMDGRGATSFRAFINWIDAQAERSGAQESGIVREGDEGVRLMTVHKAKGLEFPVVVLCDPTAKETRDEPSRHVDAEKRLWAMPLCYATPADVRANHAEALAADLAERVRIAYVAATRARDLLVVPAPGDGPYEDSWLTTLYSGLYPSGDECDEMRPGPGCPKFEGKDTIFYRSEKVEQSLRSGNGQTVRPGLHRSAKGVEAVWWDPLALKIDSAGGSEMRRQALLEPGEGAAAGAELHKTWMQSRSAVLERASEPSEVVRTVSTVAAERAPEGRGVAILSTGAWTPNRPAGARFGTLVHAVLAEVPFDAERPLVENVTRAQGKLLGARDEEMIAAVDAVVRAFAHPLVQRASKAAECRREVPIFERLQDGTLIEGVVDLAFAETDAFGAFKWIVVDYKTDLDATGASDTYIVQVETYARAIEAATGQASEGMLLGV